MENSTILDWDYISYHETLSEDFIENNLNNLNWKFISFKQNLSESFIEKHLNKIDWVGINHMNPLSEDFIERYSDKIFWPTIAVRQNLSEKFIQKYIKRLGWRNVCPYQNLSEEFLENNLHQIDWDWISRKQKLSEGFIEKYSKHLKIDKNSWLYKSGDEKLELIANCKAFEIVGDYVYTYKMIDNNRFSYTNLKNSYDVGKTYFSGFASVYYFGDFYGGENVYGDYADGFAPGYYFQTYNLDTIKKLTNGIIIQVKIHKDDISALLMTTGKYKTITCSKFTVVKDIERTET